VPKAKAVIREASGAWRYPHHHQREDCQWEQIALPEKADHVDGHDKVPGIPELDEQQQRLLQKPGWSCNAYIGAG
jgi:hypothetical protein